MRAVYIHDGTFVAGGPSFCGAPGLRPHVDMSVGIVPIVRSSNHTYPFRWNKPPETGPDAAEKHWMAQQEQDQEYMFRMLNGEMSNMFNHLGATIPAKRWADLIPDSNDIWLSLTIPEFEYDRPDWDHRVEFVGMLLTVGVENQSLPPWWDDVIKAKKAGKTIVAASASSLDFVPENLVLPAMDAFRNRDDVFVVAALVNFDPAVLNYEVPANAHIAKFIPMNKLLPLVSTSTLTAMRASSLTSFTGRRARHQCRLRHSPALTA